MVETVFVPTLTGFNWGLGEVGVIGGLPVLDTVSCFANWLFQKSSFFIWEYELGSFVFTFRMSEESRSRPTISFSQWGRVRLRRFLVNATGLIVLDACRSLRRCRRPLHPFPVVAVFGSAVDADLIIGAIGSFHWPRKAVGAAKQQFT